MENRKVSKLDQQAHIRNIVPFDWSVVSKNPSDYSIVYLKMCKDQLDWDYISRNIHNNLRLINLFHDVLNWGLVLQSNKLPQHYVLRYRKSIDWSKLISTHFWSEEFLEDYACQLDWEKVSKYQILSLSFCTKYRKLINPKLILANPRSAVKVKLLMTQYIRGIK